ncbi:MAG: DUF499 domain-containing protein [Candidatus Hodarchaeota archaeon]
MSNIKPWYKNVKLRTTVDWGRLSEKEFVADIWDVAKDKAPRIYQDWDKFFHSTFLTTSMSDFFINICKKLLGKTDCDSVVELQTGFGGGKTHNLIAAYHLAHNFKPLLRTLGEDFKEYIPESKNFEARTGVYVGTNFDPIKGVSLTGTPYRFKTPWTLIFYQLGGEKAKNKLKEFDETLVPPPEDILIELLNDIGPCLILIDEPAWSIDTLLQAKGKKNILQSGQIANFIQVLASAVAKSDQSLLIYTLPEKKTEIGKDETQLLIEEMKAAIKQRVKRFSSPKIALRDDDIFGVIRKRLFEEVNEPTELFSQMINIYSKTKEDADKDPKKLAFPEITSHPSYRITMEKAYPFHPVVLEVLRTRWSELPSFQGTRDVLRILAKIVTDLYLEKNNSPFINLKDIPMTNSDVSSTLIDFFDDLRTPVETDIIHKNSRTVLIDNRIRNPDHPNLTRNVATIVFMWSCTSPRFKQIGATVPEILLSSVNPCLSINDVLSACNELIRLDRDSCHFIHKIQHTESEMSRFAFLKQQNLVSLFHDTIQAIKPQKVADKLIDVLDKIKGNTRVTVYTNVSDSRMIEDSEGSILTYPIISLIVPGFDFFVNGKDKAEKFASTFINYIESGGSERIYSNAIIVVLPDESSYLIALDNCRKHLAAIQIEKNYLKELTESDQYTLKSFKETTQGKLQPTLLTCLSHVFIAGEEKGAIIHKTLGSEELKKDTSLADKIWDFLIKDEVLAPAIAPQLLVNQPYWNLTPEKQFVPFMSIKDIWLKSYSDGRASRFTSERTIWNAVKNGLDLGLYVLGYNETLEEAIQLKFKEIWSETLPSKVKRHLKEVDDISKKKSTMVKKKSLMISDYYLIRTKEEVVIPCPNCKEWNKPEVILGNRCPICQKKHCPRCNKLVEPHEIIAEECSHCLGKIQCQTCQRFVDKSDLRLDGKKCKICISQVQCKRCMNYVDEDNAYQDDCVICQGKSKCNEGCNSWFAESELTDGFCSICWQKIFFTNCKKCSKLVRKDSLIDGFCEACQKLPPPPLPTERKPIVIEAILDNKDPWDFINYVISPLNEKDLNIKFHTTLEFDLEGETLEDIEWYSTLKENIEQVNQILKQKPNSEKKKYRIILKEKDKNRPLD